MSYWIVDTRDLVAQRVTPDADSGMDPRFVKVQGDTAKEAFHAAIGGLAAAGEFTRSKELEKRLGVKS